VVSGEAALNARVFTELSSESLLLKGTDIQLCPDKK